MATKNVKTIIFLGAGASASDGAPIQSKLFFEYFEHVLTKRLQGEKRNKILISFFKEFFNIDIGGHRNYPTFEEILGILEISIIESEDFKRNPLGASKSSLTEIHEKLVLLMAEIINEKLGPFAHTKHNQLVEELGRRKALGNTSFISLNYDILIDNALLTARGLFGLDLDYGVNFFNFDNDYPPASPNEWNAPNLDKSISLFKLHGSLNWLFCPVCRKTELTPKEKGVCRLIYNPSDPECFCKKCQTQIVPIIIPPTYFKALSNLHLMQIWDKAEAELVKADKLVFCGYSFPDADIHVRYLLKRAQMRKGTNWEISLVNMPTGFVKEPQIIQAEKSRYERFLGPVNDKNLSFDQFSDDPSLVI